MHHAVKNRIAVHRIQLQHLPIPEERALFILQEKGIRVIEVDIIAIAKGLIGKASWKFGARQHEAPLFFDCSSLTKWLCGQRGIWIPRRPTQQFIHCRSHANTLHLSEAKPGDLLFTNSPFKNGVMYEIDDTIGHVFFVTDKETAICATNSEFGTGIFEVSFADIFKTRKFLDVGRVMTNDVVTFLTPPHREVETSDDIVQIVLQSL
ncbi:MAG: hypothetical protein A3C79_00085 [Candidatus Taylorbacteria bacterium RIFCSPHIGHO2_02_FULL_45_28]|uniref:NlpC/P60 domain-containing protein n=1 Tax=Candidatus Taylorbacteria bacterium RIFCSPHIGHO2_12_FULL_45_16 TaxID=1802315 RepID=A0A1G2MYZ2_9BACT|nr:MAG: hypothetical protein A2830_01345 [Candidatus Taylorbacteria bacterium RIFCSPHIGHO2_01_FULL_44_110]OHA25432.1 MAG: hypothetical protein A3C79_00085 [Candidatus Taylorbacteria bacterium RIFCSPHIGHO2_02_FULL_45_28]OHA29100.1 MAG: hypothetical protein A3F51_00555 [Candidatus Taylorbacteria bacterium RIFCSPHIGHO2_12_FULL_45_16]OHA33322.1 MAG: hypothetical protein A3A23_01435 [Candidatus Taylorbacteria bacterium RIFCSPLOWO2_01_FULL_45_59]OHA38926.1 MAG: hypothetical protein A3I98_02585 [Candi